MLRQDSYRDYLTETDLRTPEDVLAWLANPRCCKTVEGHVWRLRARLDRERRQACRRAALAEWRDFASDLRAKALHDAWACQWCHRQIALALAFRSAAREP